MSKDLPAPRPRLRDFGPSSAQAKRLGYWTRLGVVEIKGSNIENNASRPLFAQTLAPLVEDIPPALLLTI